MNPHKTTQTDKEDLLLEHKTEQEDLLIKTSSLRDRLAVIESQKIEAENEAQKFRENADTISHDYEKLEEELKVMHATMSPVLSAQETPRTSHVTNLYDIDHPCYVLRVQFRVLNQLTSYVSHHDRGGVTLDAFTFNSSDRLYDVCVCVRMHVSC